MSASPAEDESSSTTTTTPLQRWNDHSQQTALRHAILPLSTTSHKGSSGRVAVLGGSERYTGAPYYAAMASLQVGADLCYVWTAQEAALPLKCYSPELMVSSVYRATEFQRAWKARQQRQQQQQQQDETTTNVETTTTTTTTTADDDECDRLVQEMVQTVTPQLERLHCLIIGPGLGRSPLVFRAVAQIIRHAKAQNLALVLDADALYMLSLSEYRNLLRGYDRAVLTPNVVEYQRLLVSNHSAGAEEGEDDSSSFPFQDVVMVRKGREDEIQVNGRVQHVCAETGGLKRSGGIGDVLAGTIGTLVAWKTILEQQQQQPPATTSDENATTATTATTETTATATVIDQPNLPFSCWVACCFVKRATAQAFGRKKRAMTAPDILDRLGPAVDEMTTTRSSSEE